MKTQRKSNNSNRDYKVNWFSVSCLSVGKNWKTTKIAISQSQLIHWMRANRETFVKSTSFFTLNLHLFIFSNFFHCRINLSRDVILPLSLLTRIDSMRNRLLLPNVRSERVCRPVWESVYASRKIHEFNVTCRVRCRYVSIKWRHIRWQFAAGVAQTANDCAHFWSMHLSSEKIL